MGDDPEPSDYGDLPPAFQSLLTTDAERVVALYNGLQGMDDETFADVFGGSLDTLQRVVDADAPELATVLGLALETGTVTDATLLSVHVRRGDRVVYTADGTDPPDAAVYLPVRPADFPPGSGDSLATIDVEGYRDVVSAMIYLRYQLVEGNPERLETHYHQPLARGLAAYVGREH